MTSLRRQTVRIRPRLDLDVRVGGEGSPVLVLHGAPGPAALTPLAEHLARNHYVVAPTHPGWEGTARPDDLDSVPALAAVCLELLDRLGLSRVTVVGTSFGGWVATQVALDGREGQVSRLVLMDAIGPVIPGHRITVPGGPPTPRPSDPAARPPARGGPPARTAAALRAYAGPDMQDPGLLPRLGKLALPVLVIWGRDDTVVTPAYGRAYADAFPRSRFALVPGAGHLPLREEPEAVLALLDDFLGAQDRTTRP
ncbi:alpha/beta hydrolase [Streptomyces coelicoflavus]|uniref:alpha/beta fold hydrolase n=1 Tax=Streptomyces coelicoflavus TaxID=285562 RepID=UPI0024AD6EB1|nr:alpha/beta hydrolase [Streptomyces coelicoflavus]MDI6520374.1 alpha/beta hydrolase [Streptomyces coelicoflavus]